MANPFEGLDPDTMLRELRQQAEDLEDKAARLRADLATASAKATSPDGAVTVTLSPTGALLDIAFSAKAASHAPEALGPLVMTTVAAAQREVATRVTATLADQFDSPETMDFITRFMPKPEPATPRQDRDPDDVDDAGGAVLRKRQGRPTQDPQRTRPDDGGPLLR